MKAHKIVVGLETQVPYHNKKIFDAFRSFIFDWDADEVIGIGDHLDCPSPSRWNRGTAAEYAGTLQKEIDTMKGMLRSIREVFDGPFSIHEGNHEARINTYARTKAPAFADLDCLEVPSLLDYVGLGITQREPFQDLSPGTGWITTHGDLGGSSIYSGGTALGLAKRLNRSVICGHTHKLGILHHSHGLAGQYTLTGVETGHMMDVRQAEYVTAPNWQSGWVALEVRERRVHASVVYVDRQGRVTFHG